MVLSPLLKAEGLTSPKVVWLAFDVASNMSGHISRVQARMKNEKSEEATCVQCRSHLLQLVCVQSS